MSRKSLITFMGIELLLVFLSACASAGVMLDLGSTSVDNYKVAGDLPESNDTPAIDKAPGELLIQTSVPTTLQMFDGMLSNTAMDLVEAESRFAFYFVLDLGRKCLLDVMRPA